MSEQTGVSGDLDSLECLNRQSGMSEQTGVSGDLDSEGV